MLALYVYLEIARACIGSDCFNVLVGSAETPTPKGQYSAYLARTNSYGYGGWVVAFKETETTVYAIHAPYYGRNNIRESLIVQSNAEKRKVTKGCVNIPKEKFEKYKAEITTVIIK